jgi:VWFA-related protein
MVRPLLGCLFAFALSSAVAQQPSAEPPTPVIRATTNAVLVDAVVTDKQGKPVTDLGPDDFTVKENGKQQKIASFRFEQQRADIAAPKLPANVYSNRPEMKIPPGPVTIVLLDALNTTVQKQQYARQQMLRYLDSQFQPGLRMAVYGLTNNLIRLQGFTTNPSELRAAIAAYQPTPAANSPSGAGNIGNPTMNVPSGGLGETTPVYMFMNSSMPQVLEARIATTLAAMRELARLTGGMNGRKNLIWLSAGFPIAFSPDEGTTITSGMIERVNCPTCPPPLPNEANVDASSNMVDRFKEEIRRTATALASSQIALYPVDASGLLGPDSAEVTTRAGFLNTQSLSGKDVAGVQTTHDTMKDMASQSGGAAYYNRNDIDKAVALASADGGSYYALSYYPSDKKTSGSYRSIKVEVKRPGLQVRHREGYFAYGPDKSKGKKAAPSLSDLSTESTLIYFDAQVQPPNSVGKSATVPVLFRIDPNSVSWGDPGKHDLDLDCYIVAVAADGKVVANTGTTIAQSIDATQYDQVMKNGLIVPVQVDLAAGEYVLRLAVRDNRSGLMGNLTAPLKLGN